MGDYVVAWANLLGNKCIPYNNIIMSYVQFFTFLFYFKFIDLFLAVLGLSPVVKSRELLIVGLSLVAEHRIWACEGSVVVAQELSCPVAVGSSPSGIEPCPLH